MELYKNKKIFADIIREVSASSKINESIIEKDYFVIYLLSKLKENIPGLLFKGGTCCSHAYKAIDRFSEDIDLSLDKKHFGRNHNIEANKTIINVCDQLGFKIVNKSDVIKHSHGNFNRYLIEYPISFSSNYIKPYIQVEMSFYVKSYPDEIKPVNSILGEWLINNNNIDLANKYLLTPFDICVQKLERTFIDKIFAICDYYERNEFKRNSRHIYDLYKISQIININDPSFLKLINAVREDRKRNTKCISAKDGYFVNETLKKIKQNNSFENDYNNVTLLLLTNKVDYITSISVIDKILDAKLF